MEKSCGFLCFRDCGDKYETYVVRREDNTEKLSLKRIGEHLSQKGKLGRIRSLTRLQERCPTDRSQGLGEDDLLRRRAEIQQELQQVNESMSVISSQYRRKIQTLQNIQKEMGSLLHE